MKFLGYVTVRLNSKRIPQKSIKKIGGIPLIQRAIATLNQVDAISDRILYCSDETIKGYIDPCQRYTFVKRSKHLDADDTTFNEVLESIIDNLDTDFIVFLSCTSPFIKPATIQEMIYQIENNGFDSAFAATEAQTFCWFNNKPLNYNPSNVPRTQDIEPVIIEASSLYIFQKELFKTNKRRIGFNPYIKIVDTFEGWDIDTLDDLKMAELIGERDV